MSGTLEVGLMGSREVGLIIGRSLLISSRLEWGSVPILAPDSLGYKTLPKLSVKHKVDHVIEPD